MPKTEQINSECKAFVWLQNKLKGSYKPYTDKGKAAAKQRNLQECVTEVMKDLRQTARTREQCINTAKLLYQLADSAVRLSVEKLCMNLWQNISNLRTSFPNLNLVWNLVDAIPSASRCNTLKITN